MCPTAFLKQNWWIGASIFLEKDTWMYRIITIYMVTYTRLCIIHKYIYIRCDFHNCIFTGFRDDTEVEPFCKAFGSGEPEVGRRWVIALAIRFVAQGAFNWVWHPFRLLAILPLTFRIWCLGKKCWTLGNPFWSCGL